MVKKHNLVKNIIAISILLIIIIVFCSIYNKYNFNNFIKSVKESNLTSFQRDNKVKYSDVNSYKIENKDYNDAMFYQEVQVAKNTPYKVTCMIKTQNIENLDNVETGGAHICIEDTTERSINLVGDNDWTKVEFTFNSKNRESINIGFRLGGFEEKSKGIAWFSDFTVEAGIVDTSSNWNFAFFIYTNTDINIEENGQIKNVKLSMDRADISNIKNNIERFKSSLSTLSNKKISATCNVIELSTKLDKLSIDTQNGYYLDSTDAYKDINNYVKKGNYDHIFVIMKLGDLNKKIQGDIHDWIGLGAMDYFGIGYSNVKIPDKNNYSFTYNTTVNTFPEEVFIHEFLHTLERNARECGYERSELHNYAEYGYKDQKVIGLWDWYRDYMNNQVKSLSENNIGLSEEIYTIKPAKESSFTYSRKIDALREPANIFEELNSLVKRIQKLFSSDKKDIELGWNSR